MGNFYEYLGNFYENLSNFYECLVNLYEYLGYFSFHHQVTLAVTGGQQGIIRANFFVKLINLNESGRNDDYNTELFSPLVRLKFCDLTFSQCFLFKKYVPNPVSFCLISSISQYNDNIV